VDHIFHSEYGDRSRGAAILIRKGVSFVNESVISDTKGRFVIVIGKLCGFNVVLANVYGPNWDDPQFFCTFFAKLPHLDTYHLILGGDFNKVLQPNLDRSNPTLSTDCVQVCISCFAIYGILQIV
uniref:Endonuclease/exonuclease/phosphatase domain-containing protein n=1 Tax=Denticeps clupeoides TaxID=299321 RepID=A0AAY4DZV8_9TELE